MTVANTMILTGTLIILMGLERFNGKKGRQIHNYILLAVFMAVSAYFVLIQPNLFTRNIALSAMTLIFTFLSTSRGHQESILMSSIAWLVLGKIILRRVPNMMLTIGIDINRVNIVGKTP